MELGEPDAGGRRKPIPTGEHEYLDCDLAIIAIGTSANPLLTRTTDNLKLNQWGNIEADTQTGKTTKKEFGQATTSHSVKQPLFSRWGWGERQPTLLMPIYEERSGNSSVIRKRRL